MTRKQWTQLQARAEAGDSQAQWEVGSWLEDGLADPNGLILVNPDARAAARWFHRSANAGNPSGQIHLGVCLSTGRGVRRDGVEALRWFKRALLQALPLRRTTLHACTGIGETIAVRCSGTTVRSPAAMGTHWWKWGAGTTEASVSGATRKQGVDYFRKAIASNNITQAGREDAMVRLGAAFHEGRGVKQSNERAIKWLSQANKDEDHAEVRGLIERIAGGSRPLAR